MAKLAQRARQAVGNAMTHAFLKTNDPVARIIKPETRVDPYPVYDDIRSQGRLVPSRFSQVLVSVDHQVCSEVLQSGHFRHHPTDEAGEPLNVPDMVSPMSPSMLTTDPPDHTRLRGLVTQAFTPRAIRQLQDRTNGIAQKLLDDAAKDGTFDLMTDYAGPLPVTVICEILGVPEPDRPKIFAWGQVVGASLDPLWTDEFRAELDQVAQEMAVYFRGQLEVRRKEPQDDILQALTEARFEGEVLTEKELLATCILLLVAGFETTVNLIGNGVQALLDHPEQMAHLRRHREDMGTAVDEFLRWDSPVQYTGRIATEDTELAGIHVPRNTYVYTVLGGANRDGAVFEDPNTLDVSRANARKHLSFSSGIHYCLGAGLARMEGEVAVGALLDRFSEMRPAAPPRRRALTLLRGYESMPLAVKP